MGKCRYEQDEFCVNDQCPMRGDYCPVPDIVGVCQHEDREDEVYAWTPQGCATAALMAAGVVFNEEQFNRFWAEFTRLMEKFGYVAQEVPDDG